MCIAILKPSGVDSPQLDVLKNCWQNNPHGAGFVFNRDGKNHLRKGFMNFNQLIDNLNKSKILKSQNLMIHFRVASVGSVKKTNCHPFVISDNYKQIGSLQLDTTKHIAVHNGTFKNFKNNSEDVSDTMQLIKIISEIVNKEEECKKIKILKPLKNIFQLYVKENNSRFAIMDSNGIIHKFGKWIKDEKSNLYFSNDSYLKITNRFALTQLQFDF